MQRLLIGVLLAAGCASACADPTIVATMQSYQSGFTGFSVRVNWNDAETAGAQFALEAWSPLLWQASALGQTLQVDTYAEALAAEAADPTFDSSLDTWWYAGNSEPFSLPTPPYNGVDLTSGLPGSTTYRASYGTLDSVSGTTDLLYAVVGTEDHSYSLGVRGTISRLGVDYPIDMLVYAIGDPDGSLVALPQLHFYAVRVGTTATAPLRLHNWSFDDNIEGTFGGTTSPEFGPALDQPFVIEPQQSATRDYTYTPASRGSDLETLQITSSAGENLSVTLVGRGVGPVFAEDEADDLIEFGGEPNAERTLKIENVSNDVAAAPLVALSITGYTLTGPDADDFTVVGDPLGVIAASGELPVLIRSAGGSPTPRSATLTIHTDVGAALGGDGRDYSFELYAAAVPEPSAGLLLAIGLAGAVVWSRRRSG